MFSLHLHFFCLLSHDARDSRPHKPGAVSLMAMNLHTQIEVHVKLDKELQGLDVEEYLFTPDGNITSRFVYCE